MKPPIQIREAREEDLDATARMMVEAYSQYAEHVPAHMWQDYADEIGDVRSRLASSTLIVAESGGEIVAAVTYYSDTALSDQKGHPAGYAGIRLLAVSNAARGRGLGRLLTDECIARAKAAGNPAIALHTSDLMKVARDMYERMGFERTPEADFKPNPDSDIVAIAYKMTL